MEGKTKGSSSKTFFTLAIHKSGLGLFCDFCLIISQKCNKSNSPPTTAPACTVQIKTRNTANPTSQCLSVFKILN